VKIGSFPILWHIIKIFQKYGHHDFLIAAGYKGHLLQDYCQELEKEDIKIKIEVLDTGLNTATGGRLKRCIEHLSEENVLATYGDGVANVNLDHLIRFHNENGATATLTAVRPPARFGRVQISEKIVTRFGEKNQSDEGWINGGFFVLNKAVADWIEGDEMPFEHDPLVNLSESRKLFAYMHEGFWQPMDTLREKQELELMWNSNKAPWKIW
jgi:glucose-1-phosphate cytidylyltransferase